MSYAKLPSNSFTLTNSSIRTALVFIINTIFISVVFKHFVAKFLITNFGTKLSKFLFKREYEYHRMLFHFINTFMFMYACYYKYQSYIHLTVILIGFYFNLLQANSRC